MDVECLRHQHVINLQAEHLQAVQATKVLNSLMEEISLPCMRITLAQHQKCMVLNFPKRLLQHACGICPPDDPHADGAWGSHEEQGCRPPEPACFLHSSLGA